MERRTGFCIPLSSLWSAQSAGIGEFLDLLPLIRWAKAQRMRIIQLLPLNDTGPDASPYSAISTCALNPIYLSLHGLPDLDHFPALKAEAVGWASSSAARIDFSSIRARKLRWLDDYLNLQGAQLAGSSDFERFLADHQVWLRPYAAFTWQKLQHHHSAFWEWELTCAEALTAVPDSWVKREALIQFLCWSQLEQVRRAADACGVQLFGDLPILCNRDSADVWANPDLFDMTLSAGAPPDAYAEEGQNWGFPIFRWEAHEKTEFAWWRRRLELASRAYHLLRIDHILGFFRIWAIPAGATAREGHFVPRDASKWLLHGESVLRTLQRFTALELVGEDLGVHLPGLHECLHKLHIPGMCVHRWMRLWEKEGRFIPPDKYPALSLACVSTHDSSLLGEWWVHESDDAKVFCKQMHALYRAPLSLDQRSWLMHWIHTARSALIVNLLPEYLACFPDLVPPEYADQRINIPGTVSPANWSLRLPCSVEQICEHQGLMQLLKECARISSLHPLSGI